MPKLDPLTRKRIQNLLRELRTWHPGVPEATLDELCERFALPWLVVKRLCDSEGFEFGKEPAPEPIGSEDSTGPIVLDED